MAEGTCKIEGCGRTGRIHLGMCLGHYTRFKRTGDPGPAYIAPPRVKIQPGTLCSVGTCSEPAHCRGWCKSHYSRWERHGDVQADIPIQPATERVRKTRCTVEGCTRTYSAKGFCTGHKARFEQYGDPLAGPPLSASKNHRRSCSVDGCDGGHYIAGYCINHHRRWKVYGDPLGGEYVFKDIVMSTRHLPPIERFWARVDKNGHVPAERADLGPCWLWLASLNGNGYGQTFSFPEISNLAHRVAWSLTGRPLHPGQELDHLCRNPKCVRPDHIEQVPKLVNMLRGNGWSGRNARKTHCRRGHEYTPENTIVTNGKHRKCRTCVNGTFRYHDVRRGLTREDLAISAGYREAIAKDPCRYCGGQSDEVEHFYPVVNGGNDIWFNLVRACTFCNRSKGTQCGTRFLLKRRPVPA